MFDARGSVHHSTIRKETSKKMQQCTKIIIIPYLYEAQHVSADTPPIIRSLKLHWQTLVLHKWKVVGRIVGGRCQAQKNPNKMQQCIKSFIIPYLYEAQHVRATYRPSSRA